MKMNTVVHGVVVVITVYQQVGILMLTGEIDTSGILLPLIVFQIVFGITIMSATGLAFYGLDKLWAKFVRPSGTFFLSS